MQGNDLQQFRSRGAIARGLTESALRVTFFVVCIVYQGSVVDLLIELARLRLGMTLACPLLRGGPFLIRSLLLPLLFSFHLTEFVIFLSTQHKGRGFFSSSPRISQLVMHLARYTEYKKNAFTSFPLLRKWIAGCQNKAI